MFKIFAKYKTSEKVAVYCHPSQFGEIQETLNEVFGGQWTLVEELMTGYEILKFDDGQIYNGFEPNQSEDFRYSKAIVNLKSKIENLKSKR